MREIKPLGQSELLRDRFDSVFRRNFVELDAPTKHEKKRMRKAHFKWKERRTAAMGGTESEKRIKKLHKRQAKADEMQGKQDFLRDDLILI